MEPLGKPSELLAQMLEMLFGRGQEQVFPLPSEAAKEASPQSESPKFTNLLAKYTTNYPIARRYETFPSLLLVHTEKVCGT
jgi:hypothetical protein